MKLLSCLALGTIVTVKAINRKKECDVYKFLQRRAADDPYWNFVPCFFPRATAAALATLI